MKKDTTGFGSGWREFYCFCVAVMLGLVSLIPTIKGGLEGVFWSIDPDVMYVSNALLYIKQAQIQYIDHPGTVAIRAIALSYWPLRVVARLLSPGFIDWTVRNFEYLFLYARVVQSLVLTGALYLFVRTATRRFGVLVSLVFVMGLGSFSQLFFFGNTVSPEVFSLAILSLWTVFYWQFAEDREPYLLVLMSAISGLLLANKYTNLFVGVLGMSLVFFVQRLSFRQKLYNLVLCVGVFLGAFAWATYPIWDKHRLMLAWILRLASTTGVHGGGGSGVFEFGSYWESLMTVLTVERRALYVSILGIGLTLLARKNRVTIWSMVVALIGMLVFAKYPLTHYQLANYVILLAAMAVVLARFGLWVKVIALGWCLVMAVGNITHFQSIIDKEISAQTELTTTMKRLPVSKMTVWEWAKTKDFALLWSGDWAGGYNTEAIRKYKPGTALLVNFDKVNLNDSISLVSLLCDAQIVIQTESLGSFYRANPALKVEEVSLGDRYTLLTTKGCMP